MFLATFARTMPQFALLMIMVLLPLQMLSGGMTPRESMPEWVQQIMLAAPTTHFVMLAQGILFRGAGLDAVWPQFLALAVIGARSLRRRPGPLPQDHRVDGVSVLSPFGSLNPGERYSMETTIVTVIAAACGSLVGATATIVTTWITQRTQAVRAEKEEKLRGREALYGEFITEASRLTVDAASHSLEKPETFVKVYGISRSHSARGC